MQLVVERALIPDPEDLDALRESAQTLLDPGLQAEPRRFFAFLDEPPHPLRVHSRERRRIEGGAVISRRIESDYVPHSAEIAGSLGPILVDHWVHQPGSRRAARVLLLHGFTMGNPRLDAFLLLASQWFQGGLDVALLTLPHHGARTPPGARFSGEHFAVPHVARLSEAVREAIYEIRQLVHWLREESGAPVGVLGLSLGGYLAALSAGLCDDLDFVIPIVPPVCIGDLAWRFFTPDAPPPGRRRGGPLAAGAAPRVPRPLAAGPSAPDLAGAGDDRRGARRPDRPSRASGRALEPLGRAAHPLVQRQPSHARSAAARIARAILDHLESIEIL